MVSIQFQKDAKYHLATEKGGRKEVVITAGTIKRDLTDAEAHRWERRGLAVRIADNFQPAIPPAPPAPPTDEEALQRAQAAAAARAVVPVPPAPPAPPAGEGNGDE